MIMFMQLKTLDSILNYIVLPTFDLFLFTHLIRPHDSSLVIIFGLGNIHSCLSKSVYTKSVLRSTASTSIARYSCVAMYNLSFVGHRFVFLVSSTYSPISNIICLGIVPSHVQRTGWKHIWMYMKTHPGVSYLLSIVKYYIHMVQDTLIGNISLWIVDSPNAGHSDHWWNNAACHKWVDVQETIYSRGCSNNHHYHLIHSVKAFTSNWTACAHLPISLFTTLSYSLHCWNNPTV